MSVKYFVLYRGWRTDEEILVQFKSVSSAADVLTHSNTVHNGVVGLRVILVQDLEAAGCGNAYHSCGLLTLNHIFECASEHINDRDDLMKEWCVRLRDALRSIEKVL